VHVEIPLVVIGKAGTASIVFARHDDRGNVRISFNQWGSAALPESEPIPNEKTRRRAGTVAACADRLMSVDCCRVMATKYLALKLVSATIESQDESTQIERFRCFDNVY